MENFNISFPIDFIKKEQRVVVGIATADNVDKAGDIVDFNASLEAFKAWSGNIREMHSPIAVGKAIKYEPIQVKDPDGNMFNAIRVEAYISKGAQDTWEKVLDGTLRSFSIGGKILEKQDDAKKVTKIIKDSGLKVQTQIMDDMLRVTGKKIDDLNEEYKKSAEYGALQICGIETPFFSTKDNKCIACEKDKKFFSLRTSECIECSNFDPKEHKCKDNEGAATNIPSTSDRIIIPVGKTLDEYKNKIPSSAVVCPDKAPFYTGE